MKIAAIDAFVARALTATAPLSVFALGRDVEVLSAKLLPKKPGLASLAGQARLLHDLANIELQAMELAVRTLCEFPDANRLFREQLAELAIGESRHLHACLKALGELGYRWGEWPVHLSLWQAVNNQDSLLDRVLIVHRHLEGSGLDAGESILRRLVGVKATLARETVEMIVREEVDHVAFGSHWYRVIANELRIDPDHDFRTRMPEIWRMTPRRDRVARELRSRAGFNDSEIKILEGLF